MHKRAVSAVLRHNDVATTSVILLSVPKGIMRDYEVDRNEFFVRSECSNFGRGCKANMDNENRVFPLRFPLCVSAHVSSI